MITCLYRCGNCTNSGPGISMIILEKQVGTSVSLEKRLSPGERPRGGGGVVFLVVVAVVPLYWKYWRLAKCEVHMHICINSIH